MFRSFICAVALRPAAVGGFALAAALFLAPDGARAQQNVCDPATATDTDITCSAAAYAIGIWYATEYDGGTGALNSDVTLRIPGASGTPTTITTTPTTFTSSDRADEAGVYMRIRGDVELVMGGATAEPPTPSRSRSVPASPNPPPRLNRATGYTFCSPATPRPRTPRR